MFRILARNNTLHFLFSLIPVVQQPLRLVRKINPALLHSLFTSHCNIKIFLFFFFFGLIWRHFLHNLNTGIKFSVLQCVASARFDLWVLYYQAKVKPPAPLLNYQNCQCLLVIFNVWFSDRNGHECVYIHDTAFDFSMWPLMATYKGPLMSPFYPSEENLLNILDFIVKFGMLEKNLLQRHIIKLYYYCYQLTAAPSRRRPTKLWTLLFHPNIFKTLISLPHAVLTP